MRLGIVTATMLVLLCRACFGQELHHHYGMSQEVDRFYSYWLQPNGGAQRYIGCCNRVDCYPTEAKMMSGHWWFFIERL